MLVACGVQVCPAILLIASRCDWLQPRWVLIVALLLGVATAGQRGNMAYTKSG